MNSPLLEIRNLSIEFPMRCEVLRVVDDVSFTVGRGEILGVVGESGAGKSMTGSAIIGLIDPPGRIANGEIVFEGQRVEHNAHALRGKHIGMVFQDFALFPHLKVEDNVRFGLKGMNQREQRARIHEMLAIVGMPAYAKAYPHQLSGGQQQRIALARALAPRPGVLLLDEPFSNMDVELREQLAREVRNILKQENNTAIPVSYTHLTLPTIYSV